LSVDVAVVAVAVVVAGSRRVTDSHHQLETAAVAAADVVNDDGDVSVIVSTRNGHTDHRFHRHRLCSEVRNNDCGAQV